MEFAVKHFQFLLRFQKWNYVPAEEFDIPEAPSLGYENTSFPFVALAIFVIVAVLTAFVERIKIKLQDQ